MRDNSALTLVQVDIGLLIPYVNNSRTHSDEQIAQVAASIQEFGFTNPVLIDEKNSIIAGHGRVMAARKLNMDKVPAIILEGLTESQKKAYVIADNQLAANAGWDLELLKIEVEGLIELDFDTNLLGFDDDELNRILEEQDFEPATADEQGKLDQLDPKYIDCPHCGKEFDARG